MVGGYDEQGHSLTVPAAIGAGGRRFTLVLDSDSFDAAEPTRPGEFALSLISFAFTPAGSGRPSAAPAGTSVGTWRGSTDDDGRFVRPPGLAEWRKMCREGDRGVYQAGRMIAKARKRPFRAKVSVSRPTLGICQPEARTIIIRP